MHAVDDPAARLADLRRVSRSTRATLRSFWYPLVVMGALTLGAGALTSFAPGRALGIYWVIGYGAAFYAVGRYYTSRERRVGLGADARPYVALWISFAVVSVFAATIATNVGGDMAASGTQAVVIAVFYALLARLQRSVMLALIGLLTGAYGVGVAAAHVGHETSVWCFGVGALLVLSGLYAREHDEAA